MILALDLGSENRETAGFPTAPKRHSPASRSPVGYAVRWTVAALPIDASMSRWPPRVFQSQAGSDKH
jgi:hypothetical protein